MTVSDLIDLLEDYQNHEVYIYATKKDDDNWIRAKVSGIELKDGHRDGKIIPSLMIKGIDDSVTVEYEILEVFDAKKGTRHLNPVKKE